MLTGTNNDMPCPDWDSEERRCKKAFENCGYTVTNCDGMTGGCCIIRTSEEGEKK